jgi:hypothetical protein
VIRIAEKSAMLIAACSVGRILSENLAPSFAGSSYYLLCDLQGRVLEEIKNENRDRGIGLQAAQLLANRGVEVVRRHGSRLPPTIEAPQVFQGFRVGLDP